MNKWKKLVAILLAGVMCVGLLSECGGGTKQGNSTTEIEFKIGQAGLGLNWLESLSEAF